MKQIIRAKITELLFTIPLAKNLARKKCIADILTAMIDGRKVQFHELALHMGGRAKVESAERRIQAFFKDFNFDFSEVCKLQSHFLPPGKLTLTVDRSNRNFGKFQNNILMIAAEAGGIGLPLFWKLLDNKSGNSKGEQRIDLLEKLIAVLGKERIGCIVGDREFVGITWFKYLKINDIPFCMRLPKHHLLTLKNGELYDIESLSVREKVRYFHDVLIDGIVCNVMLKKLSDGDFLFLAGSFDAKKSGRIYRKRWSIEVLFQVVSYPKTA